MSRRGLLAGTAGGVFGALVPWPESAGVGHAARRAKWWHEKGAAGFPRGFLFRQSEALATPKYHAQLPYPEWEQRMLSLGGFVGKAVQESIDYDSTQAAYYTRFKAAHPDRLVLLHLDGNGREPIFRPHHFFAGHWLYREGTRLTAAAGPDTAVLSVEDSRVFRTETGQYSNRGDDLCVTLVDSDGRPDWNRAEQMRLLSIVDATTIEVARGSYRTRPLDLPSGAYVAPHIINGPEHPDRLLRWGYNYSTACPRDRNGRSCADALVEDLYEILGPDGPLAAIDGIELDTFTVFPGDRILADADGDGVADGDVVDGEDTYVAGVQEFCAKLHRRLGPDRLILADAGAQGAGGTPGGAPRDSRVPPGVLGQQPNADVLNGFEKQRWYIGARPRELYWSTGLNLFSFWMRTRPRSRANPRFSYYMHKSVGNITSPSEFPIFRCGAAAATLYGGAISFFDSPGENPDYTLSNAIQDGEPAPPGGYTFDIWDELVAGVRNRPNWLGRPSGRVRRLAPSAPDLLHGGGIRWSDEVVARLVPGPNVRVTRRTRRGRPYLVVEPTRWDPGLPSAHGTFSFSLDRPGVRVSGPDLTVDAIMSAEPMPGYLPGMGRLVTVRLDGADPDEDVDEQRAWLDEDRLSVSFYFRGLPAGTYSLRFEVQGNAPLFFERLTLHEAPDAQYRVFDHGAVFANPSHEPYTFDLRHLFARGRKYRRLQAKPNQDTATNNGALIGNELTVPASDALFVQTR